MLAHNCVEKLSLLRDGDNMKSSGWTECGKGYGKILLEIPKEWIKKGKKTVASLINSVKLIEY